MLYSTTCSLIFEGAERMLTITPVAVKKLSMIMERRAELGNIPKEEMGIRFTVNVKDNESSEPEIDIMRIGEEDRHRVLKSNGMKIIITPGFIPILQGLKNPQLIWEDDGDTILGEFSLRSCPYK